jgi:hypothetical protein
LASPDALFACGLDGNRARGMPGIDALSAQAIAAQIPCVRASVAAI